MIEHSPPKAPIFAVIFAFAIVYVVWGSTYFFIQASERDFPPFILGAVRFVAAGSLLLGWCVLKRYPMLKKRQLKTSFIVGNMLLFVGNGSIIWAETILPSSFVAVLVSAAPVWFVLLDIRNRKANLRNTHIILGVITGFVGVILLFGEKLFSKIPLANGSLNLFFLLLIVAGNISWCAGSLYSKYHSTGNTIVGAAMQMLFAALSFGVVALINGEASHFNFQAVHLRGWLSVIYLVTMGSLAGYSAYIWLLQVRPATQVSTNAYVNPVVAVLLGVFFGGETMNALQIGALIVILSSVFIINFDKYKS